jgi:hypothetical protein
MQDSGGMYGRENGQVPADKKNFVQVGFPDKRDASGE